MKLTGIMNIMMLFFNEYNHDLKKNNELSKEKNCLGTNLLETLSLKIFLLIGRVKEEICLQTSPFLCINV